MAQSLHRMDMRLRLGLLRDTTTAERRATAEAAARKHKPTSPTVKTEADTKAEQEAIAKAQAAAEAADRPAPKPHIRPLSESKAIESGATFLSEAFLFVVAGGLIVFESWRSRRKETTRREDVESRLIELEESEKAARRGLAALEKELLQLKAKDDKLLKWPSRILPRDVWEVEEKEEAQEDQGENWLTRIGSYVSSFWNREGNALDSAASENTGSASTPTDNAQPDRSPAKQTNQTGQDGGNPSSKSS